MDVFHIRDLTLCEFRQHNAINLVYFGAFPNLRTWFQSFRRGITPGRPVEFNENLLSAEIEFADRKLTIQEALIDISHEAWNFMVHDTAMFKTTEQSKELKTKFNV